MQRDVLHKHIVSEKGDFFIVKIFLYLTDIQSRY